MIVLDRPEAYGRASRHLSNLGFREDAPGRWWGYLAVDGSRRLAIRVVFGAEYPASRPKFVLVRPDEIGVVKHVNRSGEICVAPEHGLFFDPARPEDVLDELLERGRKILREGIANGGHVDVSDEVVAYWEASERRGVPIRSVVTSGRETREVFVSNVVLAPGTNLNGTWLAADTRDDVLAFAKTLGWKANEPKLAPLFRLSRPLLLGEITATKRVRNLVRLIRACAELADCHNVERLLGGSSAPLVLLDVPVTGSTMRALLAATYSLIQPRQLRPARANFAHRVLASGKEPITRVPVDRFDRDYQQARVGNDVSLASKRVAVVGCGSVGGRIAVHLATMGVGSLLLVDPETFSNDNLGRHLLSIRDVGRSKVAALAEVLATRAPHTRVAVERTSVLELDVVAFTDVDLVIVAVGDSGIELLLSRRLRSVTRLLHSWLEAQGAGGHAFLAGAPGTPGCFACLFDRDPDDMLYLKPSFVPPDVSTVRTIAGCAATFTPFGTLDAERAAIEATALAVDALRDASATAGEPRLVSWFERPYATDGSAVPATPYGRKFAAGQRLEFSAERILATGCAACG